MTVKVYDPGITVTLFKLIKRVDGVAQRYAGLRRQIDLTPLLGDGGAVRTSKSIMADEPGGFSVSFPDQPDSVTQDTLYALIEPMDMVEIRMSRNPWQYAGTKLPLIMRGFVSTIRRSEAMGQDGSPQRFVVIEGQDSAKLWFINAIFWPAVYATDPDILTYWQVGAVLGMAPAIYSASDFVTGMVGVLNKKIAGLPAFEQKTILPFSVAASVDQGSVYPPQQSQLGASTYWDILTAFADKPWNEIFVQDLEAGPQVVYRPVPYKDTTGAFIAPGVDPGSFTLDISNVVSLNVARSDTRVANIFWVDPSNYVLGSGGLITSASQANGANIDFQHQNNDPNLFGEKILYGSSNLQPDVPNALASAPGQSNQANAATLAWWKQRNEQLKLLNRDNSVFEEGSAQVMGSETIVPGKYLKLTRGALTYSYYVPQVDHTFMPFGSWTTSMQLIRGDGFLVRDKFAGNAFWAEGRTGPYDQ